MLHQLAVGAITSVTSLILTRFQPGGWRSLYNAPNRFNGFWQRHPEAHAEKTVETVRGDSGDGIVTRLKPCVNEMQVSLLIAPISRLRRSKILTLPSWK